MNELKGKYASAKIFTDLVENKALEQIATLLDQEFVSDSQIRIMPDVHAGAGCTIGTTMTIKDKCCPNLVGVDIGCGMLVCKFTNYGVLDLKKLDKVIRERIPSGFNIRETEHVNNENVLLEALYCKDHINIERAKLSLGTLGGGNHFIEVDIDGEGYTYLVIHSGSRHLGVEVASYYQRLAEKQMRGSDKDQRTQLIEKLKAEGRHSEIANEIKRLETASSTTPKELSYLSGKLFDDYIHDMEIVQEYASQNRIAIANEIIISMDLVLEDAFETIHNYIDTKFYAENGPKDMVLRKGAVRAFAEEKLLIPINMRDGSLLCIGKGNPDWNYSAPHGAGRLMSRSEAKKKFTVDEFANEMDGIFTTSIGDDTLDECPMAYKPMDSIISNIGATVEISKILRPVYNFKAGEK